MRLCLGCKKMTANLPPQLLKYFTPRPPLPFLGPTDREFNERKRLQLTPMSTFLSSCKGFDNDYVPQETFLVKRLKKKKAREVKSVELIESRKKNWDPISDPNAIGSDPYRTLFVARLPYDVDTAEVKSLFSYYGPITKVSLVTEKGTGKTRGYAFLEFERESDMSTAKREMDGYKLRGRRIAVDVERGRTVSGWIPRKLGGGIGGTRAPGVKPIKRGSDNARQEPYRKYDRRDSYPSKGEFLRCKL
jgi:U1 small nuclear ribonucleoprotein